MINSLQASIMLWNMTQRGEDEWRDGIGDLYYFSYIQVLG